MAELLSLMWVPALACVVLVTIHAYLGLHVLARGIIFVDLALAQLAALGSTVAILFEHDLGSPIAYLLSLGFTLLGAFVFAWSRMREREIPQEALIGVTWAVASSAAILAVSSSPHGAEHIEAMLVGTILWVSPEEVAKAAGIYAVIGLFHWFYRKTFFRISFNPSAAVAAGVRVRWWDFLFYVSFGFVVTTAVKIAGVLLVFCFLIVPSVAGVLLGGSVRSRLLIGWAFGWVVSIVGCFVSYSADLPTGATVVCSFGAALLIALVARSGIRN